MLYIGDPDLKIRDGLVYPVLAHLLHDKHLEADKLLNVFGRLLSPVFLFYDMENKDEYSILRRSFSLLQLVILFYVHRRDQIFPKEVVLEAIKKILEYIETETVLDGYDKTVGWKHSVAHSADVLEQIVRLKEVDETLLETIWNLSQQKFMNSEYPFINDEEERITTALVASLKRELLSEQFVLDWINRMVEPKNPDTFPEFQIFKNNRKHLLQALYFRVIDQKEFQYLTNPLKDAIIALEKRD